jgi:NTE family protein
MRLPPAVGALLLSFLVAACAATPRNQPIASADFRPDHGYRRAPITGEQLKDHHVVLTLSGGGTRAAALAQGVLRELEATRIAGGIDRRLLDEIDQVSSVSGGSVTAASFALRGRQGFGAFERDFLRHNGMRDLAGRFLGPRGWPRLALTSKSRIDLLVELLDRQVFHGATFADLMARPSGPFLILNSADMTSGMRFTFTQSQFDLLCSDLTPLPLAVAVSAAYPVGLTPVTLTNYSPCAVQDTPLGRRVIARIRSDQGERTYGSPDDPFARSPEDVVYVSPDGQELGRRSDGLREGRLLNADRNKRFVHLLDGGIADNLGLGEPLELLSTAGQDGTPPLGTKEHDFIVVNARSEPTESRDRSSATPGVLAMALASIGAPIDGRSGGLQA